MAIDKEAFIAGMAGGAVAALAGWLIFEQQLKTVLREEVPPMVEQKMGETLEAAGLDAATGRRIKTLAENLDRVGLL